ncbi:BON domain-containing protein [Rhizobium sp.]
MVVMTGAYREISPESLHRTAGMPNLETEVADALGRAPAFDASRVRVTRHDTVLTLEGFVNSRSEMDMAGEIAGRVRGVQRIDNRLYVRAALAS